MHLSLSSSIAVDGNVNDVAIYRKTIERYTISLGFDVSSVNCCAPIFHPEMVSNETTRTEKTGVLLQKKRWVATSGMCAAYSECYSFSLRWYSAIVLRVLCNATYSECIFFSLVRQMLRVPARKNHAEMLDLILQTTARAPSRALTFGERILAE